MDIFASGRPRGAAVGHYGHATRWGGDVHSPAAARRPPRTAVAGHRIARRFHRDDLHRPRVSRIVAELGEAAGGRRRAIGDRLGFLTRPIPVATDRGESWPGRR